MFYGCALVARRVPSCTTPSPPCFGTPTTATRPSVLATTLVNGVAEEVFFRGALYGTLTDSIRCRASTAVYALVTCVTRNPALVLASLVMGTLFGWQREATGGIRAPVLTHLDVVDADGVAAAATVPRLARAGVRVPLLPSRP